MSHLFKIIKKRISSIPNFSPIIILFLILVSFSIALANGDDNERLNISKTVSPSTSAGGGTVTYTITLNNLSESTSQVTQVKDTLPTGFSYINGTTSGLTANDPLIAGQVLTWTGSWSISSGSTRTLTFQARAGTASGLFTNRASASGSNFSTISTGPTAGVTVIANGVISGTVTSATTSLAIHGASVQLIDSHGNTIGTTTTNSSGVYIFSAVTAGNYTVSFSASGYISSSSTATVTSGSTTTVNKALVPQSGSVSGIITDAITGNPIAGATVTLTGATTLTTTTNGVGQYSFAAVTTETSYTVSASETNYNPATSASFILPSGGSVTKNLQLQPLPGTISGTVTDEVDHNTESGVSVQLIDASSNVVATTTTDGSGLYGFSGVVEGNYTVSFSKANYLTAIASVSVGPNAAVVLNQAITPMAGSVSGIITDAITGNPIAGATVTLTGATTLTTTTNGVGQYSFAAVTTETSYTVSASETNYNPTTSASFILPSGGSVTKNLQLQPLPGTISGTVTDEVDHNTESGVSVQLIDASSNVVATTTTDGSGLYGFSGVVEGNYTVSFSKANYLTAIASVSVGPNAAVVLNQAITPMAGSVSGIITDAITGNPIAGATVTLTGATTLTTTTNGVGQYSFAAVTTETSYTVSASETNYNPTTSASFILPSGGSVTKNLQLQPLPGTISGTVTDEVDHNTESGVSVQLIDASSNVVATTTTDGSGLYGFSGVVEGNYTVSFSKANYLTAIASVSVGPNAAVVLNQAITPMAGSVSGIITDAITGNPIAGATVTLTGATTLTTTTNGVGQYSFAAVTTETSYTVSASETNYNPTTSASFILPSGGSVTKNLQLQPLPGTISGTVTDEVDHNTESGVSVQLIDASSNVVATTTTDGSGLYGFSGVVEGNYTVSFSKANYLTAIASVSVGPNAAVVLNQAITPMAGSVSGIITDAITGNPIAGATVTLTGATTLTTTTNGVGQYSFAAVTTETSYTVSASETNYNPTTSASFILPSGGSVTKNLQLQPLPGTISGTVTDEVDHNTESGVSVQLIDASSNVVATTTTDGSGLYGFSGVVEGNYTVSFSKANYLTAIASVSVGPNAAVVLNQAITPMAGSVSGIITDAITGNPIAGATVTLTGATTLTTTTNGVGQYSFAAVTTETSYTVSASETNYNPTTSASFILPSGGSVTKNLQLQPLPGTISGIVTDALTGALLGGVNIQLKDAHGSISASTTTNGNGQYIFNNVIEGNYTISFSAVNYISVTMNVTIHPNTMTPLDISLKQGVVTLAIPTLSWWGLFLFGLAMLSAATLKIMLLNRINGPRAD